MGTRHGCMVRRTQPSKFCILVACVGDILGTFDFARILNGFDRFFCLYLLCCRLRTIQLGAGYKEPAQSATIPLLS